MSNPPSIHDKRVMENKEYLDVIVKSVNPHINPKESLQKLFPSASILVVKGDSPVETGQWQCNLNGCSIELPITTLIRHTSVVNVHKGVVERLRCMPVLTCPHCLRQDVSLYKENK